MKFRIALLLVVVLPACATLRGERVVDSSRELFRLQVGDTANVDLASIKKEEGMTVQRPGDVSIADIFRTRRSVISDWINESPKEKEVLGVRHHPDRSQDGCVLRMAGDQGKATVVKFMK